MWNLSKKKKEPVEVYVDPYEKGMLAALEGIPFYDNPHVHPAGNIGHSQRWFAGWCMQEQVSQSYKEKLND
jgi:hypothetical protein